MCLVSGQNGLPLLLLLLHVQLRTQLTIEEAIDEGDARSHRGGGLGWRNGQESSGVGVELPTGAMCGGSSVAVGLVLLLLLLVVVLLVLG